MRVGERVSGSNAEVTAQPKKHAEAIGISNTTARESLFITYRSHMRCSVNLQSIIE